MKLFHLPSLQWSPTARSFSGLQLSSLLAPTVDETDFSSLYYVCIVMAEQIPYDNTDKMLRVVRLLELVMALQKPEKQWDLIDWEMGEMIRGKSPIEVTAAGKMLRQLALLQPLLIVVSLRPNSLAITSF